MTSPEIPEAPPTNVGATIGLFSPLNLTGSVMDLLRERFKEGNSSQWVCRDDENVSDTSPNNVQQTLHVVPSYNDATDEADAYPRVVVARGSIVGSKIYIGNVDQNNTEFLATGLLQCGCRGTIDINLICVAETAGGCEQLVDAVYTTVLMTKELFLRRYRYHDVPVVVCTATTPSQTYPSKYQANVQFQIQYEQKWTTVAVGVPLAKIVVSQKPEDAVHYTTSHVIIDETP